jgi:phage FluMu protein Com
MIKYKCERCKTNIETDDALSGKQERCPSCKYMNTVPLSKVDRKALEDAEFLRQREAEERANAEYTENLKKTYEQKKLGKVPTSIEEWLKIIGSVFVGIGTIVLLCSLLAQGSNSVTPIHFFAGLLVFLFCLGYAAIFFAAHLVLQYLRRITNATEAANNELQRQQKQRIISKEKK